MQCVSSRVQCNTVICTVYNVQCTMNRIQCTVCSVCLFECNVVQCTEHCSVVLSRWFIATLTYCQHMETGSGRWAGEEEEAEGEWRRLRF